MPTAIATPWPRGPVVHSTPSRRKFSGCPAHGLPSWRKLRMSSIVGCAYPDRCSSEYISIEPWPADNTNLSRSAQSGAEGSNFRYFDHRTVATSAIPIGIPGCPEFAAWTASIERARMALAIGAMRDGSRLIREAPAGSCFYAPQSRRFGLRDAIADPPDKVKDSAA